METSGFVRMAVVAVLLALLSGLLLYPERGGEAVVGLLTSGSDDHGGADTPRAWPAVNGARDTGVQASGSASSAPANYQGSAPSRSFDTLGNALTLGFNRTELQAFAAELDRGVLHRFFERHSHIDRDWLHRQGLEESLLPELYALWGAGADEGALGRGGEPVYISRFSARNGGGTLRLQDGFRQSDRTLFVHYRVPEDYGANAVLLRWADSRGQMRHFDWHGLTEAPGLLQEAWYRPARDWAPGHYQVEIYSVSESLTLLGRADYRVH